MLVGLVLEFSQKQICQSLEKGKGTVMEKGRDGLVEMGKGTGGLVEMVVVEVLGTLVGITLGVLIRMVLDVVMNVVVMNVIVKIGHLGTFRMGKGKVVNVVDVFLSVFLRISVDL